MNMPIQILTLSQLCQQFNQDCNRSWKLSFSIQLQEAKAVVSYTNKDRCRTASFSIIKRNETCTQNSSALTTLSDFTSASFNRHICPLLVCTGNILILHTFKQLVFQKILLLFSSIWVPSVYYSPTFGKQIFELCRKLISQSPTHHGCIAGKKAQNPWAKNISVWDTSIAYIGHIRMAAGALWSCLCCTVWNCFPVVSGSEWIAVLVSGYKQFPLNFKSERQPHFILLHPTSCIAQSNVQTS